LVFSIYQQSALHRSPIGASLAVVSLGIGFSSARWRRLGSPPRVGEPIVMVGMGQVAGAWQARRQARWPGRPA
jgi:hypothetical protein